MSLADKAFWAKVEKTLTCWIWTGAVSGPMKYGALTRSGMHFLAHRWSWKLAFGPIPDGMHVLHNCDTPRCVNPEHLFLGTKLDNTRDMIAKGRSKFSNPHPGMTHHNHRFSDDDIRTMRLLFEAGLSQCELGRIYRTNQGNISRIVRRITWSHVE